MSHIQRVLDKARRDGFVKRTGAVSEPLVKAGSAPPPQVPAGGEAQAYSAPRPASDGLPAPAAAPFQDRVQLAAPEPSPAGVPDPLLADVRTATPEALDPLLVAALRPETLAAEQYRALRTRIAHAENGKQYRALVVTSPKQGDGKTTTALNLALTMAQEFHKRVLVVDADLRRGRLHELLGLPQSPGLSEVLTGEASLEEALVSLPEYHLTVLPAGAPTALPTEMLGSTEMRRCIDILRTRYDRVLFDTPPVVALADVGVIAPMVDAVLMVVRAGETSRPSIDRALREVHPAPVLGLVLNDVANNVSEYPYFSDGPGSHHAGGLRLPSRRRRA